MDNKCIIAVKNGDLESLKYAHEHGCSWDYQTCEVAAENGYLKCLKYAHEHGCPWDLRICNIAAKNGELECLKYAYEHGCPWNEYTCEFAAMYGQLECLKYAVENGCPWDDETGEIAEDNGHLECLRYLHKQGFMKEEFQMIKKSMEYINTTKTFLLCVNQKSSNIYWMRGFYHFYTRFISEYLKPTLYPVNKFDSNRSLVPIPPILSEKCMDIHNKCLHCSETLLLPSHSCSKKIPKVKQWLCVNCPNLDERKQWVGIIREKASKVYGFRVI